MEKKHGAGEFRGVWGFTVEGQRLEAFDQNDGYFPIGLRAVGEVGAVTHRARRMLILRQVGVTGNRSLVPAMRKMSLPAMFEVVLREERL